MKVLSKSKVGKNTNNLEEELNIMIDTVNHPFLVQIHYAFQDEHELFFILDFMEGGDLKHLILEEEKAGRFLSEDSARFYAGQILLGLIYMHSKDMIHRDLSLDNVLLDARGYARISDFGVSTILEPTSEYSENRWRTTECGKVS